MNLISRKELCRYLAVSQKSSTRILPAASRGSRIITEARVFARLNQGRVAMPLQGVVLPDLMTPEQVGAQWSLDGKPMPATRVLALARRRRNPLPHFQITRNCLRFTKSAVQAWMEAQHGCSTRV
jgi:hypothetical protein